MAGAAMGAAFRHLRGLFGGGSVVALEDGQLLARYGADGDEAAFEALIGRHGPMVLTICRAVLKNEHDVEDAFQATFLVLARKAGSIRRGETLGGWLHRVAYHASVQASIQETRRRRKEAEAAMARRDAMATGTESELAALLHEEIDRLPESHRLPVVLCDLEGLSYEEAARRLRWTVPTLRNRLARARARLKGRLARRGMIAPAIVAPASVPPMLARGTLSAATGGLAPAGASLLTHTLLKGMLMTKLKIAGAAALSALALGSAGVIAAGVGRPPEDPKPALKPEAGGQAGAVARAAPADPRAETFEVKGRVVAPDGKPVTGATVRGTSTDRDAGEFPATTSDRDGRFALRLPVPRQGLPEHLTPQPWLIASAPGHGIGWTDRSLKVDRAAEPVVTLTPEGPPIEGRVIDLEGRPVAGASVKATTIWFDDKGDLPAWIAGARNGAAGNLWQGLQQLPLEKMFAIGAKADADGRFRIVGIGRDRVVDLLVSGPGVATTEAHAFSRLEPEIRSVDRGMMNPRPFIVHAPKFQLALMPSKRVEGIARDKDTGRPIAGLAITAAVFDENSSIPAPGIEAKTDAEGRYRLEGLPRAPSYGLFVKPDKGLPYPNATLRATANTPALEPVAFDFALKRGIVVRGKVTDKLTGRPVPGAASYYPFADNPHVGEFPGISRAREQYVEFLDDGHFEFVALPGRGLLAVRDVEGRYRAATGFETIRGYNPQYQSFNTLPYYAVPVSQAILAEVDADPKAESMTLELRADPGRSVAIGVVGPDGKPVAGAEAKGLSDLLPTDTQPQTSSGFEAHGLDPSRPRRVVIQHSARKLIGSAYLKGDEAGPITIQLQPWGTLAGRVVDDEGRPRKGVFLTAPDGSANKHPETDDILPESDWNGGLRVGDDGRFRVSGLVPGLKYAAKAHVGFEVFGHLFDGAAVAPGEARDLGDLKIKPDKP